MADSDPFEVFSAWFQQAMDSEPSDPDAVSVASVDAAGRPTIRMVLMREWDARGFVFYTNLDSRKGIDYRANPGASMCFHWKSTARQVRIDGVVSLVDDTQADAYFASRPRESQIGAWASIQSTELSDRATLESRVREFETRYADAPVPRPPFWSGYRLAPEQIEFWDKRPHRLHDRMCFTREGAAWRMVRLYP